MGASIKAISCYLPEKILDNDELSKIFPEYSSEIIFKRSGILERHVAATNEIPFDLAIKTAEKFFSEHNIARKDIDFLIFCSLIRERQAPTTACLLQNKLGLSTNIGAIDVPMGCSGYIYSLALAKSLIYGGIAKNILILAGDTTTKFLHPEDHTLRFLIGDGMTATSVQYTSEENINSFVLGNDGAGAESLIIKGSNPRETITPEKDIETTTMPYGKLIMDNADVLSFALKVVPQMVNELLQKEHLAMKDIDLFIFHQASRLVLETLCKKMNIAEEKFFVNIQHLGNTSSATIPIAIADAITAERAKKGDKIVIAGFGIGLSWGSTIITL